MSSPASQKQIRYLNILLNANFGAYRTLYLFLFYKKESSKDLSFFQANEIIEKFNYFNPDREAHIKKGKEAILKSVNQLTLQ